MIPTMWMVSTQNHRTGEIGIMLIDLDTLYNKLQLHPVDYLTYDDRAKEHAKVRIRERMEISPLDEIVTILPVHYSRGVTPDMVTPIPIGVLLKADLW